MRSSGVGWALNLTAGILIRRGEETERQTHRESSIEDTSRDWGDVPTSYCCYLVPRLCLTLCNPM